MRTKVLVLDVDTGAAIEAVQSLGARGCIIHTVSWAAEQTPRSRFVERQIRLNLAADGADRHLAALFREEEYDLIVPVTEVALLVMLSSSIPAEMYRRSVLPARQSIQTALDKESVWNLAAKLGIPVPASRRISPADQPPETFPSVLKPTGSKRIEAGEVMHYSVTLARNAQQWGWALATKYRHIGVLEQQYISGHGVGVEMLFEHGVPRWTFVHERVHEYPLSGGGSSYRRSISPRPDLVGSSVTLLSALQWHGVAMVEFRVAPDGKAYLMEINPRLWGSLALAIDCGVDFPYGLLCLAANQPLPPQPSYRVGYYTRDIPRDVEWFKANLKADHSDPLLRTKPVIAALLEWFRPLLGKESWDRFRWTDLGVTFAEWKRVFREHGYRAVRAAGKRIRPLVPARRAAIRRRRAAISPVRNG